MVGMDLVEKVCTCGQGEGGARTGGGEGGEGGLVGGQARKRGFLFKCDWVCIIDVDGVAVVVVDDVVVVCVCACDQGLG